MLSVQLSQSSGPYVYLVFFDCPNCHKLIVARGNETSQRTDTELRERNFAIRCRECGFDGVLVGSSLRFVMELDFADFRASSATA